jgi:hypothetical protein
MPRHKSTIGDVEMTEQVAPYQTTAAYAPVYTPELPLVKHIVRYISIQGPDASQGHFSAFEVDAYLSSWVQRGYKLLSAQYIGQNPEGIGILYILVRQP